jgi:formate dehydrogenase subunit gamma
MNKKIKGSQFLVIFSFVQRLVHWVNFIGFMLLVITGAFLFAPPLQGLVVGPAGWLSRAGHRWGAIIVGVAAVLYVLFDPKGFWRSMKEIFTWGKIDWEWAQAAPRYYFYGDESGMPPQGRFNTGQKTFYLTYVITLIILGATGLVMWLGKGSVSPTLFQWSVLLHDLAAIVITAFFLVHLYLAMAHPAMRPAMDAIRFGFLPKDYVKHHHARYYEELFPQKSKEA